MNQNLSVKPPVFHCGLLLLVLAGVATSAPSIPSKREVPIAPAHVAGDPGLRLLLKGEEVTINPEVKQGDLEARLKKLIGEKTAMELKSRLQYDVQLDDGVTHMVFDWDHKGRIVQVLIDNPAPIGLMEWLKKTVGPGKEGMEGRGVRTTTWEAAGWEFTVREGGPDGDTVFGFEIVPVKGR